MLPKVIDIKFLNEKASKIKTYLKKINQILDLGEEEFKNKPIYPDRTKYYLVILKDELEQISCHLLTVLYGKSFKENCSLKLAQEEIFDPKLSRAIIDLNNFINQLMKENLNYEPENMFSIVKDIITAFDKLFISELSKTVKELKEKQPSLKIPVNLKRVEQNISAILSNVKKLDTFLKYEKEEFLSSNLFLDRSKYFLVVAIDSSVWICKHILRKIGEKADSNCFITLYEKNIIDKETADYLDELYKLREKLANPTESIEPEKIYYLTKNAKEYFKKFVNSVVKAIKG
jgi:uncharacterized protein YutE (UPF0331/DUF86 family)